MTLSVLLLSAIKHCLSQKTLSTISIIIVCVLFTIIDYCVMFLQYGYVYIFVVSIIYFITIHVTLLIFSASIHILHSQSEQRGGVSVSQHHLQHVSGLQDQLASMLSSCLALQKFLQTQPCADKDDRFLDCHTYPEVALPQSVIECLASRSSETNSVTIAMPSLHDVEQSMADITAQMNSFCLHEFSDSFHIPIGRVQKLLEQVKMLLHAVLQTSISPSSSSSSFT